MYILPLKTGEQETGYGYLSNGVYQGQLGIRTVGSNDSVVSEVLGVIGAERLSQTIFKKVIVIVN